MLYYTTLSRLKLTVDFLKGDLNSLHRWSKRWKISGVSRGVFWLPGNPPAMIFFNQGDDTVTGTDPHQPLTFATFGNPLETNSGYATENGIQYNKMSCPSYYE